MNIKLFHKHISYLAQISIVRYLGTLLFKTILKSHVHVSKSKGIHCVMEFNKKYLTESNQVIIMIIDYKVITSKISGHLFTS